MCVCVSGNFHLYHHSVNGAEPIVLSLEFRFVIHNNKKQYLDTVNTTFIIDKITCQLLWQNVSSLIHFLQANPMGIGCKNRKLCKYEIRHLFYFMEWVFIPCKIVIDDYHNLISIFFVLRFSIVSHNLSYLQWLRLWFYLLQIHFPVAFLSSFTDEVCCFMNYQCRIKYRSW